MGWYLDSTRIFVADVQSDNKAIIAKLNPLAGGSIYHIWGWEDPVIKIKAYVVGSGDRDTITDMRTDGALHTFCGSGLSHLDWDWTYSGYVNNVAWAASPIKNQTIRPDLDCNSPVFNLDIEFYVEE